MVDGLYMLVQINKIGLNTPKTTIKSPKQARIRQVFADTFYRSTCANTALIINNRVVPIHRPTSNPFHNSFVNHWPFYCSYHSFPSSCWLHSLNSTLGMVEQHFFGKPHIWIVTTTILAGGFNHVFCSTQPRMMIPTDEHTFRLKPPVRSSRVQLMWCFRYFLWGALRKCVFFIVFSHGSPPSDTVCYGK